MTWFPKATDVLALHEDLVALFAQEDNPIFPPGPKDLNLLESACTRPQTSFGKTEKYGSVEEKAAAPLHSDARVSHLLREGRCHLEGVGLLVCHFEPNTLYPTQPQHAKT